MKLSSKIAIVTGGSSGIGQASAIFLAKEGADLLITYNKNKDGAIFTKNEINKLGRKCEILKSDMDEIGNLKNIIDKTLENYSGIDILVNNAGGGKFVDFLADSVESLDHLLNINVKSIFVLSQLAAKEMIKRGGGSIINITSVSGISINDPGLVSYCTSKAAANMLTKGMAKAFGKYNIKVNAILPGSIITASTKDAPKEVVEETINRTPLNRAGKSEEIASMVVYLASDDASFITGSLIVIDGGLTI
jgi:NAD(P)-dependent dehydrogenase (short-subunit alcohol dehydrogenase family)